MYNGLYHPFLSFGNGSGSEFWSLLISKSMGYAIILGSVVMKLPQIFQILHNRSVLGLNIYSLYFECAENLPFVVYNMVQVELANFYRL